MEKLQKRTGEIIYLDRSKHLNAKQVAAKLNLTEHAIWKAMKIGKLKYVHAYIPKNPRHYKASSYTKVTTEEWVMAWRAIVADKGYQKYRNAKMYDSSKGEMSSKQVMLMLGWTKNKFMYYVYHQRIKFTQKGYYYVFYQEDVEAFMREMGVEYQGDKSLFG